MTNNAGKLTPADARRMAAFVLGIQPDATDETALHAFRIASAQNNPASGGNPTLYGAVMASWAMWNQTKGVAFVDDGPTPEQTSQAPSASATPPTASPTDEAEAEGPQLREIRRLPFSHASYLRHDHGQPVAVVGASNSFDSRV